VRVVEHVEDRDRAREWTCRRWTRGRRATIRMWSAVQEDPSLEAARDSGRTVSVAVVDGLRLDLACRLRSRAPKRRGQGDRVLTVGSLL